MCDVSCKNPNVMFELGMRLAFDKPTIIVMDNMTKYSFDTAPIEHLGYPRDLSYYQIIEFKETLTKKIKGTVDAAQAPGYTTFLKNFGEFQVASIENKEGSINDVLISRLDDITKQISDIQTNQQVRIIGGRIESDSDTEDINNITRKLIQQYCIDNDISERSLYKANESDDNRRMLFNYVEGDKRIRDLCASPARIRRAISENLYPF